MQVLCIIQHFASNNGVTNGFLFLVSLACFHVVFHYTALQPRTPKYVTVLRDWLLSLARLPIVIPEKHVKATSENPN